MAIADLVKELKENESDIRQTKYGDIIRDLRAKGYTGKPEKWHETKRKVSLVLPEKIQWFADNPGKATEAELRRILINAGVAVSEP